MIPTSGPLEVAKLDDVGGVGLIQVVQTFWIQSPFKNWGFALYDALKHLVGRLDAEGVIWLLPGFIYDGSSGPTADLPKFDNVPAGIHDFLYRGFRTRKLPRHLRKLADEFYRDLLKERGMNKWVQPIKPDAWWKFWQWPKLLNPGYQTRYGGLRALGGIKAAVPLRAPEYPHQKAA